MVSCAGGATDAHLNRSLEPYLDILSSGGAYIPPGANIRLGTAACREGIGWTTTGGLRVSGESDRGE